MQTSANEVSTIASRDKFQRYWEYALNEFGCEFSGMMLKADAAESGFAESDRAEILSWIVENSPKAKSAASRPFQKGLELGAGIGRLTPLLQPLTDSLVAVDFMQEFIQKNEQLHRTPNRPHDQFLCADATTLEYPDNSFDLVMWNWLMMYLDEKEVPILLSKVYRWLKPGGIFFFRESCGNASDATNASNRAWAREGNPTQYRSKETYEKAAAECLAGMETIFSARPISVYEKNGVNTQLSWMFRKPDLDESGFSSFETTAE